MENKTPSHTFLFGAIPPGFDEVKLAVYGSEIHLRVKANIMSRTISNVSKRFYLRFVSRTKTFWISLLYFLLQKVLEIFDCRLTCMLAFVMNKKVYCYSTSRLNLHATFPGPPTSTSFYDCTNSFFSNFC